MGNRSYLYLTGQQDGDDTNREICEANNNLPQLWHILLAQGGTAAAITDQRVFGDAGTDNIAADAAAGLSRLQTLSAALERHPLIEQLPDLPRHLRAVQAFLRGVVKEFDATPAPTISANLDEYSWFYDLTPEDFTRQMRAEFDATWAAIENAIARDDHLALERALGFEDDNFTDWSHWCWSFGIGGFAYYHRYFLHCDDEPRAEEFADYVPEPDPWEDDLGLKRRRFTENGRVGVCALDAEGEAGAVLVPAEWDEILAADDREREELWVRQGERWGLLHLPAGGPASLRRPPDLEAVWNFSDDLAVAQQDEKLGMLRRDGNWQIAPAFDDLWDFSGDFAVAYENGQQGYIDRSGRWAIPPQFDGCGEFDARGLARVDRDGRCGLIRKDGSLALPLEYDHLYSLAEHIGWILSQEERFGFADADGVLRMVPEWDEIISPDERTGVLYVRRGACWGVFDLAGQARLPCHYTQINLRTHNLDDQPPPTPEQLQFAVGTPQGHGLVDGSGRELIPCRFDDIDELASQWQDHGVSRSRDLLLVRETSGTGTAGVWNLAAGSLWLPCRYAAIAPFYVDAQHAPHLLLVAPGASPDDGLFGILAPDGQNLFAAEYRWLAENHGGTSDQAIQHTRYALVGAFSKGQAFLAQPADGDEIVWLFPDGRRLGFVEKLAADHAAGDPDAALTLARALRHGDGIAADRDQALLWFERAAHPAGRPASPEALAELADLQSEDPAADPAQIRRLFEEAFTLPGKPPAAWARNRLGCQLLDGSGGPEDKDAAFRHFQLAAEQGDPYACYNLGLCKENGWGTPPDAQQARQQFEKAARRGIPDAAYRTARLLEQQTANQSEKKKRRTLAKAAECYRQEIARPGSTSLGESCLALARLIREQDIAPADDNELARILKTGTEAGHEECAAQLAALEGRPLPANAAPIERPRWLLYFMLAMAAILLYRCGR